MPSLNSLLTLAGLMLFSTSAFSTTAPLSGCFPSFGTYTTYASDEISPADNTAGHTYSYDNHIVSPGGPITAECNCPSTMKSSAYIFVNTWAGSPLAAGPTGYGVLTSKLAVDFTAYPDAINHQDGAGMSTISINKYPTDISDMTNGIFNADKATEAQQSVCSASTKPSGAGAKRQFQWNVMGISFYITQPIFGEEIIPDTVVVENYACLYYNTSSSAVQNGCTTSQAQQVSSIRFGGSISAPLSCTINAGSQIEVEFPTLVTSTFTTPGTPPKNAIKAVDISYHCDNPAQDAGNQIRIKMTLTADQGVSDSGSGFIARMIGRDDLGVRMYDDNDNPVVLDGSADFPITLDSSGNGTIKMKASPVSTTDAKPAAGKYEGNVTVKMDIK